MKIRTRITLFVVGAGFIASLLLSLWLIYELLEQPFRILRKSLYEEAERAVQIYSNSRMNQFEEDKDIGVIPSLWLTIREPGTDRILYRSPLAKSVDLETVKIEESGLIGTILTSAFENLRYSPSARKTYMVRYFEFEHGDKRFLVQAARGMEKLDEEIREVFWVVVSSLLLVTLVLFALGRIAAGKIIRPIQRINGLAQNISDRNLSERVPVGPERDELGELSETINHMLDRLQYSFTRQKEFLFDTSHELKTPLTTIRLAVEELCSGETPLPEKTTEHLHRLESQVLRMERLVKSLLNLSSLEALQDLALHPVDISTLLRSLAEDYEFLAEGSKIRIQIEIPDTLIIQGDAEKLRRAFSNVLDNAIKYNRDEGQGIIQIFAYEAASLVSVVIRNTGETVSQEDGRKIFEQFYRIEKSRSLQKGGSGLGLAIVKRTVELHGGSVRFESDAERGGDTAVNSLTMTFPNQA